MTGEKWIEVLNDLNKLHEIPLEDLSQAIKEYPYCQNFQFLYAKKLQILGQTDHIVSFQKLSHYVLDKPHLFHRMTASECEVSKDHSEYKAWDNTIATIISELKNQTEMEEATLADTKSFEQTAIIEEEKSDEIIPQEMTDDIHDKAIDKTFEQAKIIEKEKSEAIIAQEITEDNHVEPADIGSEITEPSEAIFLGESPNIKENSNESKTRKRVEETITKPENKRTSVQKSTKNTLPFIEETGMLQKKKKKKKSPKKIKKSAKNVSQVTERSDSKAKDKTQISDVSESQEISAFAAWLQTLKPSEDSILDTQIKNDMAKDKKKDKKTDKKKKKKEGKVKKLLKKEKKKSKKQKKKAKLQSKIDASLQRKPAIVSETLADIMVKQGHYKEAIEIYQELVLINPEKNSYFASQIKKLKKLC